MVQVPNNVSNHLTTGLLAYFHATGRFSSGINLFEKLRQKNTEVSSLLAKVLLMGNEEVGAVRVLHAAIKESPMDYVMLDTQAEFLKSKALKATDPAVREERLKMALGCADKATVAAPSEFGTWARLADVFVAMEDWESALVTLNSCPMFTYQDKDAPHMPEPRDVHLPVMPETKWDEIDSETEAKYNEPVHPSLLSLRGSQYKGTFKKAYSILTEMTKKIGWDQLLRIRSQVFVMEEEYRTERQPSEKRNASIDVIRGTPEPTTNGSSSTNGDSEAAEKKDGSEASASVNGDADADADASSIVENDTTTPASAADAVAQPSNTVAKVEAKAGDDTKSAPSSAPSQLRFNNKRLCERWLDSLFMVLYEDLRIYTIWRTEAAQYRQGGLVYKKGAEEWEILGSLAARLHHDAEALEAWRSCLGIRFSPKAAKGVLELSRKGGQASVRDTVGGVIRLVAWQYRWFSAWSPQLVEVVRGLVEEEGALKVRTLVQASGCPAGAAELSHGVVAFLGGLRSSGSEG